MALNLVSGPSDGVSTDNAMVRWDGTTGRLVQNSGVLVSDVNALSIPNTAGAALQIQNTADPVTNFERLQIRPVANVFTIDTAAGGTGTERALLLRAGAGGGNVSLSNFGSCSYTSAGATTATGHSFLGTAFSASSGTQSVIGVTHTVNQSGTALYNACLMNITQTALGSGSGFFFNCQVSSAQRFSVSLGGTVTAVGNSQVQSGTVIPAGGLTGAGMKFFSTANFGTFGGSGAPTLSAAKGSLYLRSDGTGTNDRAYINTDGGTTWTAMVTVA